VTFYLIILEVKTSQYHTELAVSYINEIIAIVNEKHTFEGEIDVEAVDNNSTICKLRHKLMKFLESTNKYNLNTIFEKLPYEYMIPEIAFILACDKQYSKAFEICIQQLNNIELAKNMCKKIHKLIGDDNIFFKLFEVLYKHKLHSQAMDILEKYATHMSHNKVLKVFRDDEELTEKHFNIFSEIYQKMEKAKNQKQIFERITNYEVLK
jgi:hypothetical protein